MENSVILPKQLVTHLFHQYFEQRSLSHTLSLFCEDIRYVGSGLQESGRGIEELTLILGRKIELHPAPCSFCMTYYDQLEVGPGCVQTYAELLVSESGADAYEKEMRISLTLRKTEAGFKICFLQTALLGALRKGDGAPSLAREEEELGRKFKDIHRELVTLIDCMPGGVFKYHAKGEGTFSFISENMLAMLGYTREEFVDVFDNKFENMVYEEDRERVLLEIEKQIEKGDTDSCEYRIRTKSGELRWFYDAGKKIVDENGVRFFYVVIVDITEEKRARDQKEVAENYAHQMSYSSIIEKNLMASFKLNLTQNWCGAGQTDYPNILSLQEDKTVDGFFARVFENIPSGEHLDRYRSIFGRENMITGTKRGKTHFSCEHLYQVEDGKYEWIITHADIIKNPVTGDLEALIYCFNTNEQKMLKKLFETVVSTDYDYIIELNAAKNSYVMYYSEATASLIPDKNNDNYEQAFADYCHDHGAEDVEALIESMKIATIKRKLAENSTYSITAKVKNKAGKIMVKKLQYSYIDRERELVLLTRVDITELFESERQKSDALSAALISAKQANVAKTDFLSRMSHEIRTPMNAIIGMSALAAQAIGNDEQVAECLSKIGISSRFLLSLINDILDMSRIESGKMLLHPEKFSFVELLSNVNSICYTQAGAKDIDYECIIDPKLNDFYIGDSMKLQQIIINILSNAVKFTPPSGRVSLTVKKKAQTQNHATLRFIVNDTGCGISDEFLPHLFDAFAQQSSGTTTRYGGTGLGLAICKNLVSLMDGQIEVRSILGIGSEFTVDVKLGVSEETKNALQQIMDHHFEKLRTLVVDDDPAVCEYTVNILEEMKVAAEWVDSGRKAVDCVREKWDKGKGYDVVMVDWKMPEMDGIETAKQIRKIVGPDVTIIIMTAYEWASIEHEAKLAGVNLLINKPMFKSTLVSAFHKVLNSQSEIVKIERKDFCFEGKRLLLVEDHPLNVEVAKRLLEQKGFWVEHAENGVIAIEKFATAAVGYYDAILMDIRMPIMDGLQAATTIRHLKKPTATTIPIIAMTANAFDEDIEKSKMAGMDAHLAKPIEPQLLYRTLDFYLHRQNQKEN